MGFKCGIVGLPNVGKSTLFNALTRTAAAQAANYPFCTIEPNTGEVAVPDPRLQKLAAVGKSKEIIPTRISFVDIAGLVRGASKGEGLGNQFLANIREVDAIVHVLRCFEDDDITHVEGRIDPVADAETVETELMLADLDSLERRIVAVPQASLRQGQGSVDGSADDGTGAGAAAGRQTGPHPSQGNRGGGSCHPARPEPPDFASGPLCLQRGGEGCRDRQRAYARRRENGRKPGRGVVTISAAIEAEVAQLPDEEAKEFLADLGLDEPGLDKLIRAGYDLLHLITYFTVGPKETRAWTVHKGAKAPQAAGVIHTDFERGFIRAQTIAYDDFVTLGGEVPAKEAGKARDEGKEYVVQDGDVMLFKFNT